MLIRVEKVSKLTTMIFVAPVVTLVFTVATTGVIPSSITPSGVVRIFLGTYASQMLGTKTLRQALVVPAPILEHGS